MNVPDETPLAIHIRRIRSEYLEMPGLRLTCAQGQRLWGLDATVCAEALQSLMESGFLRRTDAGQYVRLTDGMVLTPRLRTAKARLDETHASQKADPSEIDVPRRTAR